MSFYQDNMANLMKEFVKSVDDNFDKKQIQNLTASLQQFSLALKKATENISLNFFTEEMQNYIAEMKESEKLSQSEFEAKYSYEIEVCKKLGRAGWVVSEHSNPRKVKEWYSKKSIRYGSTK